PPPPTSPTSIPFGGACSASTSCAGSLSCVSQQCGCPAGQQLCTNSATTCCTPVASVVPTVVFVTVDGSSVMSSYFTSTTVYGGNAVSSGTATNGGGEASTATTPAGMSASTAPTGASMSTSSAAATGAGDAGSNSINTTGGSSEKKDTSPNIGLIVGAAVGGLGVVAVIVAVIIVRSRNNGSASPTRLKSSPSPSITNMESLRRDKSASIQNSSRNLAPSRATTEYSQTMSGSLRSPPHSQSGYSYSDSMSGSGTYKQPPHWFFVRTAALAGLSPESAESPYNGAPVMAVYEYEAQTTDESGSGTWCEDTVLALTILATYLFIVRSPREST
ncbi:hypothetical protein HDU93_003858, partial [Gonapodya sp. JEL0774]